jgi:TrmH family RNA methyltransferase
VQPAAGRCWVDLDSIHYPGNLGFILRTCNTTGAAGIILLGATSDPYDPEAVRARVGAIFSLGLVRASTVDFIAGGTVGLPRGVVRVADDLAYGQ